MSDNSRIKQFIDLFTENAESVLGTITNEQVNFVFDSTNDFDLEAVTSEVFTPLVLLTVNFSGDFNFPIYLCLPAKAVAALSDLMLMGDGQVEYNEEEHNDAAQEMFNQVFGPVNTGLKEIGTDTTGTVGAVAATDLEAESAILAKTIAAKFTLNLIGDFHTVYMMLDAQGQEFVDRVFFGPDHELAGGDADMPAGGGIAASAPVKEQPDLPPVSVSKADFSSMPASSSKLVGNSVNVDLLMDIVLPISVELGKKTMRIKDILEMGQGSVIELDKLAGDFVDILVNGQKFAVGEIMVVDDNFAIRIVNLISREERIRSLGGV